MLRWSALLKLLRMRRHASIPVLGGGNLLQKFKDDELQNTAVDGDEQREHGYPIRAEGRYVPVQTPWPRDEAKGSKGHCRSNKTKAVYSSKTRKSMGSVW